METAAKAAAATRGVAKEATAGEEAEARRAAAEAAEEGAEDDVRGGEAAGGQGRRQCTRGHEGEEVTRRKRREDLSASAAPRKWGGRARRRWRGGAIG